MLAPLADSARDEVDIHGSPIGKRLCPQIAAVLTTLPCLHAARRIHLPRPMLAVKGYLARGRFCRSRCVRQLSAGACHRATIPCQKGTGSP
jgi:hypothetical protein